MTRPPDLEHFADEVRARVRLGGWAGGMGSTAPVFVSRAPGRLDVMGGIADYSGALVLQWPIREATRVALRRSADRRLSIRSHRILGPERHRNVETRDLERHCDVPLEIVADPGRTYDEIRAWFAAEPSRHWAAYVAGVFSVLAKEQGARFEDGADILIESDVPEGKGVSSSAAIEAATMAAVVAAWGLEIEPKMRAVRCQQVENLIVGAPCGVMDQMASICGEAGSLMELLCQPAEFLGTVQLPASLGVWGIDSGIRHAVTGPDYGSVRVGAFMGYRILADLAGLPVTPGDRDGHVHVHDTRWHGYLANVGVDAFRRFEPELPLRLDGRSFLARYGGTTDRVTRVDPARAYDVRVPTAHPIFEHARVHEWARRLRAFDAETPAGNAQRLGALMFESHASYSACGLGSDGTDRLVAMAREAGPERGVYGAKITGGGSGGTVAFLADTSAGDVIGEMAIRYATETGREAYVFAGSSPGAARVGTLRLDWP